MTDHQGAWDMFAGHPGGTEADMMEGGYHFAALKGTTTWDGVGTVDEVEKRIVDALR